MFQSLVRFAQFSFHDSGRRRARDRRNERAAAGVQHQGLRVVHGMASQATWQLPLGCRQLRIREPTRKETRSPTRSTLSEAKGWRSVPPRPGATHFLSCVEARAAKGRPSVSRADREVLLRAGFLRKVIRGWYVPRRPDEADGDTTSWFASMCEFIPDYAT